MNRKTWPDRVQALGFLDTLKRENIDHTDKLEGRNRDAVWPSVFCFNAEPSSANR